MPFRAPQSDARQKKIQSRDGNCLSGCGLVRERIKDQRCAVEMRDNLHLKTGARTLGQRWLKIQKPNVMMRSVFVLSSP